MASTRSPNAKAHARPSRGGAPRSFLAGQLLIAMPSMGDPRFERSVILICAHDENHAMGIVINNPIADFPMSELLAQLNIITRENFREKPVYFGGPVQTERGMVLHSLDYCTPATMKIGMGVGITGSRDILNDIAGISPAIAPPAHYFLAIGYAGWSSGQLEEELGVNAWIHCGLDPEILFAKDESNTWRNALSKLGVTGAMLSREWMSPRPENAPLN